MTFAGVETVGMFGGVVCWRSAVGEVVFAVPRVAGSRVAYHARVRRVFALQKEVVPNLLECAGLTALCVVAAEHCTKSLCMRLAVVMLSRLGGRIERDCTRRAVDITADRLHAAHRTLRRHDVTTHPGGRGRRFTSGRGCR